MKPERPGNIMFPMLISIAVILGFFIVGGFANQFLKQTPDFNDEIGEPSPEEMD